MCAYINAVAFPHIVQSRQVNHWVRVFLLGLHDGLEQEIELRCVRLISFEEVDACFEASVLILVGRISEERHGNQHGEDEDDDSAGCQIGEHLAYLGFLRNHVFLWIILCCLFLQLKP